MRRLLTSLLAFSYLATAGAGGGLWVVCTEHDHSSHVEAHFDRCCAPADEGERDRCDPGRGDADDKHAAVADATAGGVVDAASGCDACLDRPLVIDGPAVRPAAKVAGPDAGPASWAPTVVGAAVPVLSALVPARRVACSIGPPSLRALSTILLRC